MDFECLRFGKEGKIATVTLDRPQVLNAINRKLLSELKLVAQVLWDDREVRVAIVTAQGERAFSAGADINELEAMTPMELRDLCRGGIEVLNLFESMPKVVIAAVNGYALGGGWELALSCDFVYASENAKFGLAGINLGSVDGWGGMQKLVRLAGMSRAKELIFTGNMISASEALRLGLVNKVCSSADLMCAVVSVAQTIAEKSAAALTVAKAAVNEGANVPLGIAVLMDASATALLGGTEERTEGMRAFLEKRKRPLKQG